MKRLRRWLLFRRIDNMLTETFMRARVEEAISRFAPERQDEIRRNAYRLRGWEL